MNGARILILSICLIPALSSLQGQSFEPRHFLYLSDQRIVTVELVDQESLILNYINLTDTFQVLISHQLALLGSEGIAYGHAFRLEESDDPASPFAISKLIRPGQFLGFLIAGKYDLERVNRVVIQVSGRILELEPLDRSQFELVAARIGELDLEQADRESAIRLAGFERGFGRLYFSGSEEASRLESLLERGEVLPPLALETPAPRLPSSESDLPDPVVVRVGAFVTQAGGLRDIQTIEGINEKLDAIAEQTVRNSWRFLPAVSNNDLAGAEVKLNVVFRR